MVEWLANHSDRWQTVHAISRRPPAVKVKGNDIRHHAIDLLNATPEDLADQFTKLEIEAESVNFSICNIMLISR